MTQHLTSGNLLIRNSVINLAGKLIPILLAVFTTSWVIGQLGTERYGLFAFCWLLFGYFNLFDFGFGRSLTKFLSERLAQGHATGYATLIVSVNRLQYGIGIVLGLALWLSSRLIVTEFLDASPDLFEESVWALRSIAVYLPFLLTFYAFNSVLESKQRFDLITLWQTVFSIVWYGLPALMVFYSTRVDLIVGCLLLVRLVHWGITRHLAWAETPPDDPRVADMSLMRPIVKFGGWLAIDNTVAPIVTQIDRYLISGILGLAALGYYQAPLEIVTKMTIIPMAFGGVLYPALSHAFTADKARADRIYSGYFNLTQMIVFPLALLFVWFGDDILRVWLSLSEAMSAQQLADFMEFGAPVLKISAIGFFFNSLALLPSAYVQTLGRPDLSTKAHLIQAPVYAIAAYVAVLHYGLTGAVWVMSFRLVADLLMMAGIVQRLSDHLRFWRMVGWPMAVAVGWFGLGLFVDMSTVAKSGAALIAMAIFSAQIWFWAMDVDQRRLLSEKLRRIAKR